MAFLDETGLQRFANGLKGKIDPIRTTVQKLDDTVSALPFMTSGRNQKIKITIPGKDGSNVGNRIAILRLHRGNSPYTAWNDISSAYFKDGFDNIYFTDADGNRVDHEIISCGSYDFVRDDTRLKNNKNIGILAFSDGTLVRKAVSGSAIEISEDNGATWTGIGMNGNIAFIDSQDRLYIGYGDPESKVCRFTKGNWTQKQDVLNWSAEANGKAFSFIPQRWCEDSLGNIFLGRYREEKDASIYMMPSGANVFNATPVWRDTTGTLQHIHHMYITNDIIYAGVDVSTINASQYPRHIVSRDHGTTWSFLPSVYCNSDMGIINYNNGWYYGSGEAGAYGGITLWRAKDPADAATYETCIDTMQLCRTMVNLGGNQMLALCGATYTNNLEQVYYSEDNGDSWVTAYVNDYQATTEDVGDGCSMYQTGLIVPKGAAAEQVILSGRNRDYALRGYFGSGYYSGIVLLRTGAIPPEGKVVYLNTDAVYNSSVPVHLPYNFLAATTVINVDADGVTKNVAKTPVTLPAGASIVNKKIYGAYGLMEDKPVEANHIMMSGTGVNIGNLAIAKNNAVSFEFWIGSHDSSVNPPFGNAYTANNYLLDSSKLQIYITTGRSLYIKYDGEQKGTTAPVHIRGTAANQMLHLVIVIKADMSLIVYVNGRRITAFDSQKFTSGKPNIADCGTFYLGAMDTNSKASYQDGICGFAAYNKALSESEVKALRFDRYFVQHVSAV